MSCEMMNYKEYLGKLKGFKALDWVENHLKMMEKPNFWTILEYGEEKSTKGRSAHETRSSRMFRWLIDANETHQLGNIFAAKLVALIGGTYDYQLSKNKQIKATAEDMDIDVFYTDLSKNMCIAIEVKQFAKEGKSKGFNSQLDKYERLVAERIERKKQAIHPYYIYLTPLKEKPTNNRWIPVSYQEIIDILDQIIEEQLDLSDHQYKEGTKKIIGDFKDDLKRSVDHLKRDHSYITEQLSDKEKALTLTLAREIQHETDSIHLEKLMAIEEDPDLKKLILIAKDYIYAQNHSPNDEVRILLRKVFNYLSEKTLDTDLATSYTVKETRSSIKQSLIEKYGLIYESIELTRGKGQGINMYCKDKKYRCYFSGDTHGTFPNDGIQSIIVENKSRLPDAEHVKKRQFKVADNLILEDKIRDQHEKELDLDELMEKHIMIALQELSDHVKVTL